MFDIRKPFVYFFNSTGTVTPSKTLLPDFKILTILLTLLVGAILSIFGTFVLTHANTLKLPKIDDSILNKYHEKN